MVPPPPAAAEGPGVAELEDDLSLPGAAASESLAGRLARLLAERRFGDIVTEADLDKRAVAADAQVRLIVEQAHARLEAAPYVKTFVDSARQALQSGETAKRRSG